MPQREGAGRNDDTRNAKGQFGQKLTDEQILQAFRDADEPLLTARSLPTPDGVSVRLETRSRRLRALADDDELATVEAAGSTIYYLPERVRLD